jgi:hypothetical protein
VTGEKEMRDEGPGAGTRLIKDGLEALWLVFMKRKITNSPSPSPLPSRERD